MRYLLFLPLLVFPLMVQAETLRLAVAANFTDATRQLISSFEQQSGHKVKVSFGSTGKLYAQIINGAPFDVFLAADTARPKRLVEEGYAVSASRFTYAQGRLALWSANKALFDDGREYLRQNEFRRLAIANPKTAPYGAAAKQVLQALKLWDDLSAKLVRGDSIAQTFQFTATGNAEVGLVAVSQVMAWPNQGSLWIVPEALYQPIMQQAVLLNSAQGSEAGLAFLHYLKSKKARTIIQSHGYAVE